MIFDVAVVLYWRDLPLSFYAVLLVLVHLDSHIRKLVKRDTLCHVLHMLLLVFTSPFAGPKNKARKWNSYIRRFRKDPLEQFVRV